MPDITSEPMTGLARHQRLQSVMELVLRKLRRDPKTVTIEDVQNLASHADETDPSTAEVIAAVADVVARNQEVQSGLGNATSWKVNLSQAVGDLHAAVKAFPCEVNSEILKTTQSIVSMMQKAISHTNAPHPELEAELQQEYAKIVPKVERGVVTKAEANHLHSLEARAHGHTERGGLTATAQSVAARRERQASISSPSGGVRSRTNSHLSNLQEGFQGDTSAAPVNIELPMARMKLDAAATKSQRPEANRSPEKILEGDPRTSPTSPMRRFHSLSDSTNATRGDGKHDAAFPRLQSCGPAEMGGGSENIPRTREPEYSHLAI